VNGLVDVRQQVLVFVELVKVTDRGQLIVGALVAQVVSRCRTASYQRPVATCIRISRYFVFSLGIIGTQLINASTYRPIGRCRRSQHRNLRKSMTLKKLLADRYAAATTILNHNPNPKPLFYRFAQTMHRLQKEITLQQNPCYV